MCPQFRAYVDLSAAGRNSLWRISSGFVLAITVYVGAFGAVLWGFTRAFGALPADSPWYDQINEFFNTFEKLPIGMLVVLLGTVGLWLGTIIALRWLHKRPVSTLLGFAARLDWRQFWLAFTPWFLAVVLWGIVSGWADGSLRWNTPNLAQWALLLVPMLGALLLQTSGEEIFFRGYLQQNLAARFRSPWAWLIIPNIIFALLHWGVEADPVFQVAIIVSAGTFGLAMSYYVYRTGNLGAALGAHFANNISALLIVSADSDASAGALFVSKFVQDPDWSTRDIWLASLMLVAFPLVPLAANFWSRSWLRIEISPAPAQEICFDTLRDTDRSNADL